MIPRLGRSIQLLTQSGSSPVIIDERSTSSSSFIRIRLPNTILPGSDLYFCTMAHDSRFSTLLSASHEHLDTDTTTQTPLYGSRSLFSASSTRSASSSTSTTDPTILTPLFGSRFTIPISTVFHPVTTRSTFLTEISTDSGIGAAYRRSIPHPDPIPASFGRLAIGWVGPGLPASG